MPLLSYPYFLVASSAAKSETETMECVPLGRKVNVSGKLPDHCTVGVEDDQCATLKDDDACSAVYSEKLCCPYRGYLSCKAETKFSSHLELTVDIRTSCTVYIEKSLRAFIS